MPFGGTEQVIAKRSTSSGPTLSAGYGVGVNTAYVYWPLPGSITQAPANANAGDPTGPDVTTFNAGTTTTCSGGTCPGGTCIPGTCTYDPGTTTACYGGTCSTYNKITISMATDSSNVYWIDTTGGYYRAPLFGAFPTTATQIATGLEVPAGQIAVDAKKVYWIGVATTLFSMPLTGGNVTPILAIPNKDGESVAVDATNIYWTTGGGNGSVMRMPLSGGTPTAFVSGQKDAGGLALNSTHIFWTVYAPGPPSNPILGATVNVVSLPKSGQ